MKRTYLKYLALIILVFIAGIFAYRLMQPSAEPEFESEVLIGSAPGRGFNRTANVLGFDAEQLQKFNKIEQDYRIELADYMHEMREIETKILLELSQKQPDKGILKKYASETGIVQAKIKQLTIEHFLNLKGICTSEQAEKLTSLFNDMQRGFGQGQGNGRGYGKRQGLRRGQVDN